MIVKISFNQKYQKSSSLVEEVFQFHAKSSLFFNVGAWFQSLRTIICQNLSKIDMFTDKLEEELGKKTLASGQLSWGEERGSARETTSRNTYGLPMLRTFNFDSNGLDDMLEKVEAKKEPFEKLLLPT